MSVVSGKADLLDHIYMEKQYPVNPNNPHSPLVSDLMECFKIFKTKTGGVIYQHEEVDVNVLNQFLVEKMCDKFKIIEHKVKKVDNRYKDKCKEHIYYTYKYWDKEYKTLKELNKKGVYITKEITFNYLEDLIPYFPYVIAFASCDENSETIVIANESEPEERNREHIKFGIQPDNYYQHQLARCTRQVILDYYSDYKERTVEDWFEVEIKDNKKIVHLPSAIDRNWDVKVSTKGNGEISTPIIIDDKTIDVSECYLFDLDTAKEVYVKYVHKREQEKLILK